MTGLRLTRRGYIAVWLVGSALTCLLYWAASSTPDLCLTGAGYYPCASLDQNGQPIPTPTPLGATP